MSKRLKKLTDLSKWKESVSGKGESSPRVPNDTDERRQINRRVEITLTPSRPAEAKARRGQCAAEHERGSVVDRDAKGHRPRGQGT